MTDAPAESPTSSQPAADPTVAAAGARPLVMVTGANGLVGSRTCAALVARGADVRAVVRRGGTAPGLDGVDEVVGDFGSRPFAADVVSGATAVVTTVHPMGSGRDTQHRVGVEATATIARAAAEAGVDRFVHVSTAAVYDRSTGADDVDESSALVGDDGGNYPVTKRDAEAALAEITGVTRVLLRPPAIFGASDTSVWNALRPQRMRDDEAARHGVADASLPWVHVDDLAAFAADLAVRRVGDAADPAHGPVVGGCTPVDVCAGTATWRDYLGTVAAALGVEPVWDDEPAWTGSIRAARAHAWGWRPVVDLQQALGEVHAGLRGQRLDG